MVGAYLSSFSFGAFPNRLDQQLMVEIASLLLMAVETDAAMQKKKKKRKVGGWVWGGLIEQQKLAKIFNFIHTPLKHFYLSLSCINSFAAQLET